MVKIKKGKRYKIITDTSYFLTKYGVRNPIIEIEDTDKNVFGEKWEDIAFNNQACLVFSTRVLKMGERHDISSQAYYGKIITENTIRLGELVFDHELEELKNE